MEGEFKYQPTTEATAGLSHIGTFHILFSKLRETSSSSAPDSNIAFVDGSYSTKPRPGRNSLGNIVQVYSHQMLTNFVFEISFLIVIVHSLGGIFD